MSLLIAPVPVYTRNLLLLVTVRRKGNVSFARHCIRRLTLYFLERLCHSWHCFMRNGTECIFSLSRLAQVVEEYFMPRQQSCLVNTGTLRATGSAYQSGTNKIIQLSIQLGHYPTLSNVEPELFHELSELSGPHLLSSNWSKFSSNLAKFSSYQPGNYVLLTFS